MKTVYHLLIYDKNENGHEAFSYENFELAKEQGYYYIEEFHCTSFIITLTTIKENLVSENSSIVMIYKEDNKKQFKLF